MAQRGAQWPVQSLPFLKLIVRLLKILLSKRKVDSEPPFFRCKLLQTFRFQVGWIKHCFCPLPPSLLLGIFKAYAAGISIAKRETGHVTDVLVEGLAFEFRLNCVLTNLFFQWLEINKAWLGWHNMTERRNSFETAWDKTKMTPFVSDEILRNQL